MGPGLVTGASDDDPSGIATYSQAGAQYGLSFLWAALLTLPLMAAVQEICDRTALATGTGLGELAVRRFHRAGRAILAVLLVALIVANGLNIAADLVAIGSGMQLLHAGPTWHTFVPHVELTKSYLALLVAVLGTTISPYLFFWQSAHRLEEMREETGGRSKSITPEAPEPCSCPTQAAHEQARRLCRHDVLQPRHFRHHRGDRPDAACPQQDQHPKCRLRERQGRLKKSVYTVSFETLEPLEPFRLASPP
jgi:hypothetical protein